MHSSFPWLGSLAALVVFTLPIPASPPQNTPQALTQRIDQHLHKHWEKANIIPAPPANDYEFLRRVTLDLVGRIPTVQEIRQFQADSSANKHTKVIRRLLASPGYSPYWATVWRRTLIPQADSPQFAHLAPPFENWLQKELAANVSYDRLVRQMLLEPIYSPMGRTAAANFFVASQERPEAWAANSSRVFLGVNLDCAQCHDHPFAQWTREDFWGFAAFFAKPRTTKEESFQLELTIPGTKRVMRPKFLTGKEITWPEKQVANTGQQVLADWITAKENPFFARNAVNRVWAYLLGTGLVEPLDNLSEENSSPHPELLEELAEAFIDSEYDLKFLIEAITSSRAYRLTSAITPGKNPAPADAFAVVQVRGLSGEQLYDSLRIAAGFPLDPADPEQYRYDSPRLIFVRQFQADRPAHSQRSILQALKLMNGPLVQEASKGKTVTALAEAPFLNNQKRLNTLFLATLSRPATEEEIKMLTPILKGKDEQQPRRALGEIFWVLVNSVEFNVNH